jgi:hypothetical protein
MLEIIVIPPCEVDPMTMMVPNFFTINLGIRNRTYRGSQWSEAFQLYSYLSCDSIP